MGEVRPASLGQGLHPRSSWISVQLGCRLSFSCFPVEASACLPSFRPPLPSIPLFLSPSIHSWTHPPFNRLSLYSKPCAKYLLSAGIIVGAGFKYTVAS